MHQHIIGGPGNPLVWAHYSRPGEVKQEAGEIERPDIRKIDENNLYKYS
jgi:hypothetical protein